MANIIIPQTLSTEQQIDKPGPHICNLFNLGDFAILLLKAFFMFYFIYLEIELKTKLEICFFYIIIFNE